MTARSPESLEHNRRLSREAKRRRVGTCVECGGITRYNGTEGRAVSVRCYVCSARRNAIAKRGTGETGARVLARLEEGPATYTEIAAIAGGKNRVGQLVTRLLRYGLIVRPSRGVYRLPEDRP